jgi:hypothetical protein
MGKMSNAYKMLVGKPKGKQQLERYRHGWEDNIKYDLYETEYEVVNWINLTQDRDQWRVVVKTVMNLQVP